MSAYGGGSVTVPQYTTMTIIDSMNSKMYLRRTAKDTHIKNMLMLINTDVIIWLMFILSNIINALLGIAHSHKFTSDFHDSKTSSAYTIWNLFRFSQQYSFVLNHLGFLYALLSMPFLHGNLPVIIKYHPQIEVISSSIINALTKKHSNCLSIYLFPVSNYEHLEGRDNLFTSLYCVHWKECGIMKVWITWMSEWINE